MKPITPEEATYRNLRPLTSNLEKEERWIAENICRDLRRGGIPHATVQKRRGIQVWRSNSGYLEVTR